MLNKVEKGNKSRRLVHIQMPFSLLFIPLLFVGAGLSIPYSFVARNIQRRRERAFQAQMKLKGRVITWPDFVKAMSELRGTFIEERYSFKGPDRWWWTSEDIYEQSPHAIADWRTMGRDEAYRPFALWCRQRYTDQDNGRALLVSSEGISPKETGALWSQVRSESGNERWIEVVPPEALRGV